MLQLQFWHHFYIKHRCNFLGFHPDLQRNYFPSKVATIKIDCDYATLLLKIIKTSLEVYHDA
jgi:hypothetical protein